MCSKSNKGFTLIELLVVIAIIALLATIVLASLNAARNKGNDAAIAANINNMRSQAEIYYDSNSMSYSNLCTQSQLVSASSSITKAKGVFSCSSVASQFRLSSILSTGEYFCIDNNGASGRQATAPTTSQCN